LASPTAKDWVDAALLRNPDEVMRSNWYQGEENMLILLKRLTTEESIVNDPSLRSGVKWLLNFAAKCNPTAATLLGQNATTTGVAGGIPDSRDELDKRKAMAKARQHQAMEKMKAQMAKFAQAVGQDEETDDDMSIQEPSALPDEGSSESVVQPTFSTPIRNRANSDANSSVHAMDLGSPGDFILTTPPPSYPTTPKTPRTPCSSGTSTPKNSSQSVTRLLNKRPQCIICGGTDNTQIDGRDTSLDDKTLVFCAYSQASTVAKGGGAPFLDSNFDDQMKMKRHVGVFVNLCGHAVHSSCCESYLKTVRDDRYIDRLEGGKRKEFKCPLCQRLSNCLVPFIDVGADWIETPQVQTLKTANETNPDESMVIDDSCVKSLHDFLSSTKWWSYRNKQSMIWDGHCSFRAYAHENEIQGPLVTKHIFGKKDLLSAWNRVLKAPRLAQRRARGSTSSRTSDSDLSLPNLEHERQSQKAADVWRRFMDTISDTALKADAKRLGEDVIVDDYGEFRHNLTEKAFYNKMNKAANKEPIDVSMKLYRSILAFKCSSLFVE
jgi:hypothetical protein